MAFTHVSGPTNTPPSPPRDPSLHNSDSRAQHRDGVQAYSSVGSIWRWFDMVAGCTCEPNCCTPLDMNFYSNDTALVLYQAQCARFAAWHGFDMVECAALQVVYITLMWCVEISIASLLENFLFRTWRKRIIFSPGLKIQRDLQLNLMLLSRHSTGVLCTALMFWVLAKSGCNWIERS